MLLKVIAKNISLETDQDIFPVFNPPRLSVTSQKAQEQIRQCLLFCSSEKCHPTPPTPGNGK